jgi:hypothetical protein
MTKIINPGRVEIRQSVGSKGETHEGTDSHPIVHQEVLNTQVNQSNTSQISVSLGLTKSLGNYEFARVDVTVTEPCSPESKDEKFAELYKIASGYVAKVNADISKK